MKDSSMNKTIHTAKTALLALGASFALALPALAQDHSDHSAHAHHGAAAATPAAGGAQAALTAGEITRIDARTGKLTIRHEDIKNLDMPAMTMVFALKNAQKTAAFKPGDKVLFAAEDEGGTLTITHIQPAS
ncbi:Copper-binding protein [Comamonas aquatilis]